MKTILGGLKYAVLAALTMGFALGAQAGHGESIIVTKGGVDYYFDDLGSAFAEIGENGTGTVAVIADPPQEQQSAAIVPNGSDITLDLYGSRIDWTTTNGDALIFFPENTNGKLTINAEPGGTISSCCDSSEVTNSALIVYCKGDGDLTVNGGTFICSNKVGAATHFFKSGNGNWTFNGGTYMACGEGAGGAHFLYCADATGTTRITGGTYDIRATAGAAAGIGSNAECYEKITITGGDFDVVTAGAWGGAFSCGNGSMVVDGGDFSVTGSVAGVSCFLAERGGTTILSNGTFRAETTDGYAYAACANMTATLTIAGGTYFSKAYKDTAATVVGKEQAKLTLVGSPVINNGATEGTAWNLAVQILGAYLDFSGYTGANLANFAVFSNDTYGVSYVTGDMAKFGFAWIQAGYFSTRPNDEGVQGGMLPLVNLDAATKDAYPWVIGKGVASVTTNGVTMVYGDINDAWMDALVGTDANPATLKLLADVKLTSCLAALSPTFDGRNITFDLNDHVLSPADTGYSLISFSSVNGSFTLVDTATTKTKKYFTETTGGLWTLTNETTSLFVEGGVITGGKSGRAVDLGNGAAVEIRDVSFVGNGSSGDCGALYVDAAVNVYSTRFYGNRAKSNGAAICGVNDGRFLLANCDVRHNVAGNTGGGVYVKNKCVLLNTTISDNVATNHGAGVYFEKKVGCLAAGTKILMADGTEKVIEEVVEGDLVATFDHEGGTNSSSRIYLAYAGPSKARPFTLEFEEDAARTLTIVDLHDLLEETSHKYVRITEANAATFVGKRFYGRDGTWHTLTGVTFGTEEVSYYSLYSAQHQNVYANGLLTAPDDADHLLNLYELDAGLKADPERLAADIATYGLSDPDRAAEHYGVDRQYFDDGNLKYLYIAIGKGLVTLEKLVSDFKAIGGGSDVTPVAMPAPKMVKAMMLGATPSEPKLADFESFGTGVLVLGMNAVVTNNFVGAITNSNIHLATESSKIVLADGHVGVCAGVTRFTAPGQVTTTNNVSAADVALFTSDDPAYVVSFVKDHLELTLPGIDYTEPVYVTAGEPASGIAYWVTNTVYNYTTVGSSASAVTWGATGTTNWYVVKDADVKIDGGVTCQGHVNLILCDGAKLVVTNVLKHVAGIATDTTGSFAVYGQPDGAGALEATGGDEAAGIGGTDGDVGANITLNGGMVRATGDLGAGIGGAYGGAGTNITLNGGTVTAISVDGGAGIGGGYEGVGSDITINGGTIFVCGVVDYIGTYGYPDGIGNGADCKGSASGVVIDPSANVLFNLTGVWDDNARKWLEPMVPMLADFDGFVIMTPETAVARTLVGGCAEWTAASTFALANGATRARGSVDVNGGSVLFANRVLELSHADGMLKLVAHDVSTIVPTPVANTTVEILTNGVPVGASSFVVRRDAPATVVYTADPGYYFSPDVTAVTNTVDTSTDPAVVPAPNAPFKMVTDVPCAKTDETTVEPAEKPDPVSEETWAKATNIVASVTNVQAAAILADSVLTNAVEDAKNIPDIDSVNRVLTDVEIVVTPTGAESDPAGAVRAVKMDVTPLVSAWAEVTSGTTVSTNEFWTREPVAAYSGKPMLIAFDVANLASEPMRVIHWHGTETNTYFRGDEPTEATFTYDAETKVIALKMSKFSELEIRSDIQVGDDAYAQIGADGTCTVFGTGDVWNRDEWPGGTNPLAAYKKSIANVVVESGVTRVGSAMLYKFYAVTNVTVASTVTNVADHAFYNCHSLRSIAFQGTAPTFGEQAVKFTAMIRMNGSIPEVYTMPDVTSPNRKVWAKDKLTDADWTDVTDLTDAQRAAYHFFKIVME